MAGTSPEAMQHQSIALRLLANRCCPCRMAQLDNVATPDLFTTDFLRFGTRFLPPSTHDIPFTISLAGILLITLGACIFYRRRRHTIIRVSNDSGISMRVKRSCRLPYICACLATNEP